MNKLNEIMIQLFNFRCDGIECDKCPFNNHISQECMLADIKDNFNKQKLKLTELNSIISETYKFNCLGIQCFNCPFGEGNRCLLDAIRKNCQRLASAEDSNNQK